MSKKRKRKPYTEKPENIQEQILEDMLECNTECADLGKYQPYKRRKGLSEIEYLLKILPGMGYIESQFIDHLFSDGVTTGSIPQNRKLDAFLYKKNMQGNTNLAVLRDVIRNAAVYGETGIRWYQGNIYMVNPGTYGALVRKENGIEYPAIFFCTDDGRYLNEETIELPENKTISDFFDTFERQHLILLDTNEFVNIRNDTSKIHGESPLLRDQLRIDLLVSVYSRLGYDVEYDGPGRMILRPKDGFIGSDINDVSSTTILDQSFNGGRDRAHKAREEVKRIGREIKESSSDSVILLSNAFDEHIEKLPRVTKATEFFDWIKNEGKILAQALGLAPSLLELGDVSGNVSMQRILDEAMMNNVVPQREKYMTQISEFISRRIGVEKISFGKYELASAPDRETMILKSVEAMSMLNQIEGSEKARKLIDDLADRISYDIHNDDGSLVELDIKGTIGEQKEKNNEQHQTDFGRSGRGKANFREERN